jgi:flagellar hook-associated protein 2
MATPVSIGGLGNGIDWNQVITQLVAAQQVPITNLQTSQQALQTKLTDYTSLDAKLQAFQGVASSLRTSGSFDRSAVTVSDNTVLDASADSTATPGSYTVQVTQLAAAHQITNKAAKAVASTTTSIVSGASATFAFHVGSGTTQTVTLGTGATIQDLQDAINNLGAGVSASVLNTGSSSSPAYRLVLTSNNTGASNNITVTADTTSLDFLNSSGTGGTDTLQAAQDATLILGDPNLNPVTLTRSSNTVTDAIAGVTLNLKSNSGPSPITVNVTRDVATVAANIKSLVSGYNDIVNFVNSNSNYDVTTNTGGDFVGESTTRTVLTQIRQALAAVVGNGTISSTAQIGFQTQRDGTITVDDSALNSALSTNYNDVKNLFIGQTGSNGVAEQLFDAVTGLDDPQNGAMTLRKSSLTDQISSMSDDIQHKEDALTAFQDQLKAQFASLDALLQQLKTQSTFITQLTNNGTLA